jgi:glycosyltransferase involved in cell wall biosynthesis
MTIWVASELYHPELTSTGFFVTGIAEGLAQHGRVGVEVLCAQPTYALRGTRSPRHEVRNRVRIWRARSTTFHRDRLVGRAINTLTLTISLFLRALRVMRRGDQLLVVTNPPALPFAMILAAKIRGTESVLLIHDLYPDVLVATGMASNNSLLVRSYSRAARWLYRNADRIIVVGRDQRDLVVRRFQEASGRISVIPNWADTSRIRPAPAKGESLRRKLGLEGKFVVQHLGNMGRTHGIDAMAEAAERLLEYPDIHFLVVGSGFQKEALLKTVADTGLTNVSVLAPCSDDELEAYLNACDIALISFRSGMTGVSVPSRMYNVMAAGKPILAVADPESELARVVSEEAIGTVVQPDDSRQLAGAILAARDNPSRLDDFGRRARQVAVDKYSANVVLGRYLTLFGGGTGTGASLE